MEDHQLLATARRTIQLEAGELNRLADRIGPAFCHAIHILRDAVDQRGKIVVLGVGKSGHIGDKIAATLTSTGSPSVVLNSLNALHGDLGVITDGDAVLALSYSGETPELLNILGPLARFDVRIVAITGKSDSTLARAAGAVLDVSVEREACPLNLAPTSSTTSMLALGDALAMTLLEARGFQKEDFAKFHPGGQIGRHLLLKVGQIMRPAESTVTRQCPVIEALGAMTSAKCGAALIIDDTGRLEGIFTHGDFARHFPTHPDIGTRPVSEFMTPSPISISSDKLAAEVLHILQHHRIDDLVVVDASGKPVGIVDSQDLTRLKLV